MHRTWSTAILILLLGPAVAFLPGASHGAAPKIPLMKNQPVHPGKAEHGDQVVNFIPGSQDAKYTGGKRYGMLILKVGTELLGYLEIKPDGSVVITENAFFNNSKIELESIKTIRWLQKVVVRLHTGEIILGHLVRRDGEHILVETLTEPKSIKKISNSDILSVMEVKSLEVSKRKYQTPRISFQPGWLLVAGSFSEAFKNGPVLGVSLVQSWQHWIKWNSPWIPDVRLDLGFMRFKQPTYEYEAFILCSGLHWYLDFFSDHKGIFYLALLPGLAFEKATSPNLSGTNRSFVGQVLFGYEYPIQKRIFLGSHIRLIYTADQYTPLFSIGAGLNIAYQF